MSLFFTFFSICFIVLFVVLIIDKKKIISIPECASNKYKIILFIFTSILVSYAQVFIVNFQFPYVGHDVYLVELRSISTLIYAIKNGIFATEWATPLSGSGILVYANPQYHQYSIFYFLNFLMPFWDAYLLVIFLFSLIGFISVYFIFRDIFNYDYGISLTGACFFSCTGYYVFHLMVGHWAFAYHPLTAFIVWAFFSPRFKFILRLLLTSLAFSIMLFGGAIQTIFFYTCFTLLGCAALLFKPNKDFFIRCVTILLSTCLAFILSFSKILPSFMLAVRINRGEQVLSDVPFWSIFDNLYYAFLVSTLSFFEKLLVLKKFFKISYPVLWERDISFPFILIVATIIIAIMYKKEIKNTFNSFWQKDKFKVILFSLFILLYVDMFYDKGLTHKMFPILNNINLTLRLASSLILPTLFIFIFLLKNFVLAKKNRVLFLIAINVFTIMFFVYRHVDIFIANKKDYVNMSHTIEDYRDVWNNINNNYDKYNVADISTKGDTGVLKQFSNSNTYNLISSRYPYEPIYGYELQTFKAKELGSPKKIVNGEYNFTHPNSLLFFDADYPQFSGFTLDQEDDLDKFLNFEKVDWKLPKIFSIANKITIISHLLVFASLFTYIIFYFIKLNRKQNK